MPPEQENKPLDWPYWPIKLRTSSSHEEAASAVAIATKRSSATQAEGRKVKALKTVRVEWKDGKMVEVPGSEQELPADLVLLAMGFVSPVPACSRRSASRRTRGNAARHRRRGYRTNVDKVFAAGDMRQC